LLRDAVPLGGEYINASALFKALYLTKRVTKLTPPPPLSDFGSARVDRKAAADQWQSRRWSMAKRQRQLPIASAWGPTVSALIWGNHFVSMANSYILAEYFKQLLERVFYVASSLSF